nr:nuclear pore complex protein NUP98B-like isoform X2 [Lolium perenne]
MGSSSSWSTPAFGSSCSTTAFGSSYSTPAFGSSCPTPAFGPPFTTPAFGLMSPNPAFGLSPSGPFDSFGSSWSTQAVGQHPNIFRTPMPHQHAPFPPTPFGATIGQHSSSVPGFTMSSTPPFGVPSMPSPFVSLPSPFGSFDPMPVYNSKSHEELRHEDYQRGDKGNPSLPKSMVPSANHPWQPQPPVQLLEDLSEAHVKPSVVPQSTTQGFSCNTNNPFWLRSAGSQPPVFSFPPSSSAPAGPPLFSVPLSNHPWQPQPPVQPLKYPSEAHVKPSVGPQSTTQGFGCNTNNPFWLRSVGPQPPVFSFPPSSSAPATSRENIFSNTASYRAPDTSFTQGGSLLSSSVSHSAPAPSPNGQCTSINIDHSKKAVELLLPIDITTVRIRFYPRNDDTGSLASQVHNVRASPTPVSFSIYPGENQDLTIRSVEQPASQTGKTSSSTGPAGEQKGNISDVPLTDRSPFGAPGCEVISESVLPRLYKADYYTLPSIAELAARECQEPGSCSHVKDFTVGRHGYGSVKFEGETDVRMLDITSIVEFKDREINAYMDESKRPPVGQELNKPAEITLLNVKCVDQKTGLQLMEGPAVDAYKEVLAQWTKSHDAEFISFDPVKGEWKFSVKKL